MGIIDNGRIIEKRVKLSLRRPLNVAFLYLRFRTSACMVDVMAGDFPHTRRFSKGKTHFCREIAQLIYTVRGWYRP